MYAYTRTCGDDRTLTVLNFSNDGVSFDLPAELKATETLIGTHGEPPPSRHITLAGNEGRLLRLA